jgi:predicted small secreted protein
MKRIMLLLLLAVFFLVSACNTVAGVGRDISGAGQALERTADYARTTPPAPEILDEREIEIVYPPAVAPK